VTVTIADASARAPRSPAASSPPAALTDSVDRCLITSSCSATRAPPTTYDSLALAIIDSIWSIGVRYAGVINVLDRPPRRCRWCTRSAHREPWIPLASDAQ
jgi:hypothetical protein